MTTNNQEYPDFTCVNIVKNPTHHSFKDLTGKTFGRLKVLGYAGKHNAYYYWYCKCECGKIKKILRGGLKRGTAKSCGCYNIDSVKKRATTHGMTKTPEYKSYHSAKGRCHCIKNNEYHRYGGRGIKFLFKDFSEFHSHLGDKPNKTYTIDRIDVNGHYEVGNVRWASKEEQSTNKRNNIIYEYNGKIMTLSQWCKLLDINYKKTHYRIKYLNWELDRAFNN